MNLNHSERDITPELALRRKITEFFIRGQIVAICNAVIGNYMEVLEAACELNRLGFELFGQMNEGFIDFAAVCSEVDHLPLGEERQNWDSAVLAEKDKEVKKAAALYSEVIREACKPLLTQLGPFAPSVFE